MNEIQRIKQNIIDKTNTINVLLDFNSRSHRIDVFEWEWKYKIKKLLKNSSETLFESYNIREIEIYLKWYCSGL